MRWGGARAPAPTADYRSVANLPTPQQQHEQKKKTNLFNAEEGDILRIRDSKVTNEELAEASKPRRKVSFDVAAPSRHIHPLLVETPGKAKGQTSRGSTLCSSRFAKRLHDAVILALGLRPNRSIWGLESFDLGFLSSKHEDWFAESPMRKESEATTWWSTPLHKVPHVRHLWGEAQYDLHPGAQELFLDLIFVGVAYRIGSILKYAFYNCTPVHELSPNATLADSMNECVGLPLGLLHALAPFMCMYMMWQVETNFRAKFEGCTCTTRRP
jgi:hypothetical protein